jgi:hypothetical protein
MLDFKKILEKEAIEYLENIFFNQNISKEDIKQQEKNAIKDKKTFWKTLYEFVHKYRSQRLADSYKRDDQVVEKWLYLIAPSCCYPITQNSDGTKKYECVFCDLKYIKNAFLVKHYKEKHFAELPDGILGIHNPFTCEICDVTFTRKENLTLHLISLKHKKAVDPFYEPSETEKLGKASSNKSKRENEIDEWENKRRKIEENNREKSDSESSIDQAKEEDPLISLKSYFDENSTSPFSSIQSGFLLETNQLNDLLEDSKKKLSRESTLVFNSNASSFHVDFDKQKKSSATSFQEESGSVEANQASNDTNKVEKTSDLSENLENPINPVLAEVSYDESKRSAEKLSQNLEKSLSFNKFD